VVLHGAATRLSRFAALRNLENLDQKKNYDHPYPTFRRTIHKIRLIEPSRMAQTIVENPDSASGIGFRVEDGHRVRRKPILGTVGLIPLEMIFNH